MKSIDTSSATTVLMTGLNKLDGQLQMLCVINLERSWSFWISISTAMHC